MCVCDDVGAKSPLDDEIFVAPGRMPLSAKAFGDVGGRFQVRSAFRQAFASVCLRDGSAYAGGRRRGEIRKTGATSASCGECAARRLGACFGRVDPGIGSTIDAQPGDVSRPTGCRVALRGVMPLR